MKRRVLLATPLLAAPPALAQPRMRRIGMLSPGRVPYEMMRAVILPALAREGFAEGRNLELVGRVVEGFGPPLRRAAAELLALRPEVVSAVSLPSVEALFALDNTTPIVMFGSSPLVGSAMADSFSRPGRSVTGVVILAEELNVKRLELAVEAFPAVRHIGFLSAQAETDAAIAALREIATRHGVTLTIERVQQASAIEEAVVRLAIAGAGMIVVGASPILASGFRTIHAATLPRQIPTVCEWRYLAAAGCTMSYGPEVLALRHRHAHQIARILRGEHPSVIPIEVASRFELVINLAAARQLGTEFPIMLLARADELIE